MNTLLFDTYEKDIRYEIITSRSPYQKRLKQTYGNRSLRSKVMEDNHNKIQTDYVTHCLKFFQNIGSGIGVFLSLTK